MKLRRLLQMGILELACRGRQEAWKWLERIGGTAGVTPAPLSRVAGEPGLAAIRRRGRGNLGGAAAMLLERFRRTGPARFFDGATSDGIVRLLAPSMRAHIEDTVAVAEAACQRRFDLLGHRGLTFGDPIDWHLDPVSGRRAPRVHWSRLDPLDPERVGDSKVTWELNRHQWLVRLAEAYRLTGDERYARTVVADFRAWTRANPPGIGINWASSLEVALRLIAWCWSLMLLRGSSAVSADALVEVLAGIRAHASHVERYLSYYFSPNTHLTGEALGLFYAGVMCPELRPAARWRALGARILVEQLERHVLPDGVYFEQSTCYQRYTIETYLHFMILAGRNRIALAPAVGERVQALVDVLLALRRPDGAIPSIGDADGGWLLPLATRAPDDVRGVFATAAALFGRSDYAWAAGGPAPETAWLLGPVGLKAFEALRPAPPRTPASRHFPDGGLVVMRSGWGERAHQLIFDVGPLGCPINAGHGHADLLSIQCSVFGRPCLVDAGTYGYTGQARWRDFFRGTTAHSTVVVDGVGQAVPAGPFKWETRPRAQLHRWRSTPSFDFADALHRAYAGLADPVVHRRRVLFVKPRLWIVVDDLGGQAEHTVELRFQFAPMTVTVDPGLWARAHVAAPRGLLVKAFAPVSLKAEVHEGDVAPIQGWVAPDYGQRQPAPVVTYSTVTRLPLRIVTLLLPTEDVSADPPAVSPLFGGADVPAGLIVDVGRAGVAILVDDPGADPDGA